MKKKKKTLSLEQTARKISDILWEHLKTLPVEERNRRLVTFHKLVQAKLEDAVIREMKEKSE